MANVRISELPAVTTVTGTDVFPVVASTTTSKLSVTDLANSLPQVTSSLSASVAISASYALSASWAPAATVDTGSFATTGSNNFTGDQHIATDLYVTGSATFAAIGVRPDTTTFGGLATLINSTNGVLQFGKAEQSPAFTVEISGSALYGNNWPKNLLVSNPGLTILTNLGKTVDIGTSLTVTGSVGVSGSFSTSVVIDNNVSHAGISANNIYPVNFYNFDYSDPAVYAASRPGFPYIFPASTGAGSGGVGPVTYYFNDVNIGQNMVSGKAGILKFARDFAAAPDTSYFTLVSAGNNVSDYSNTWYTANGRDHALTVTGSFLSLDGVTLGRHIADSHYLTGSLNATGSFTWKGTATLSNATATETSVTIQNGYVVLTQVSQSLDFADDAAAAAGGVPLGGLYRNGNFVLIRIS